MNIKTTIYEKLTDEQRSKVMIEAQARGDTEEVKRLNETSPQPPKMVDLSVLGLPNVCSSTLQRILKEIDGKTAGLPDGD